MESSIAKIRELLFKAEAYWAFASEEHLSVQTAEGKWSKKEILGHLIDSALNNLTRFTEIGYQPQPYAYREYNQKELTGINRNQYADKDELFQLWLSLNKQIIRVMESATAERLALKISSPDPDITDLRSIMKDYPLHMQHHINQIISP